MNRIAVAGILSALLLAAQDHAAFDSVMKSADSAIKALNKLETKTGLEAVRHAERLASVYESMISFWRQRHRPDAVKYSIEGKAAALALMSAAHAGNAQEAAASLKSLGATCRGCHQTYRIKRPDGTSTFPDLWREPNQPRN
jgi:cytochrome c556